MKAKTQRVFSLSLNGKLVNYPIEPPTNQTKPNLELLLKTFIKELTPHRNVCLKSVIFALKIRRES